MSRRIAMLLGALAVATTGCVGIPDEGPIVEAESTVASGEELGYYNDPRSPTPGAAPTDIVKGFLDAQTAIPLQTNTAEEFLTKDEAATWQPETRTITYAGASLPQGSNRVAVELEGAIEIDGRGSWLGPLAREEEELTFTMRREDGEWRIADAPDALIVPESWFGQAYRRVSLFYLDPTARILVPEPVYVPRGDQLASSLVDALLEGPVGRNGAVERSAFPPGLELDLSVSVSDEGVADVALLGGAAMPTDRDAVLLVTQLARTLSQDPTLARFRVTFEGERLTLPSGETEFSMDQGENFDPAGAQSTSLLFGLREGLLVLGPAGALEPATGPMGVADLGVRTIGVSLSGSRVAGVTTAGDRVLLTDVRNPEVEVAEVLSGGDEVLPPVWDFANRLWMLNQHFGSAEVTVYDDERARGPRAIEVPGISGEDVTQFLVSRDGSRMVAVLDRPRGDRVVVSRIRYDERGRAVAGSRAREIEWDDQTRLTVLGIGWSSPTSIVVAHRLGSDLFQVRTMSVDGAPAGLASISATVQDRPLSLATSARTTDPVYVVTRNGLVDALSGSVVAPADPGLTFLDYVGG